MRKWFTPIHILIILSLLSIALTKASAERKSFPAPSCHSVCHQKLPLTDPSPGWVIIAAWDREGPDEVKLLSIQEDAIRMYVAMVNLGVSPDHIILLKDGKDREPLDNFLRFGEIPPSNLPETPFRLQMHNFVEAKIPKIADLLKQRQKDLNEEQQETLSLFDDLFLRYGNAERFVPVFGKMDRGHFKIAQKVVSLMARPDQFVAVIVSTAAGETMTPLQVRDQALLPEDFRLADCKAKHRFLILDAGLRNFSEARTVEKEAPAYFRAISAAWADKTPEKAVFLSATDGTKVTFPRPGAAGSAFLRRVCIGMDKRYGELSLQELYGEITDSYSIDAEVIGKIQQVPKPLEIAPLLVAKNRSIEIRTLFCQPDKLAQQSGDPSILKKLSQNIRIQVVERLAETLGLVTLGDKEIAALPAREKSLPKTRAEVVRLRLRVLLMESLLPQEVAEVSAVKQGSGWSVRLPVKVHKNARATTLVPTDNRWKNGTPAPVAAKLLAYDVRTIFLIQAATTMASETKEEFRSRLK